MIVNNKRPMALALAIGGISTVAVGGVIAFLVQPWFIGVIIMASASIEFVLAAIFWKQGDKSR